MPGYLGFWVKIATGVDTLLKTKEKKKWEKNVLKHDYIFDAALTVKQIKI